MKVNFLERRQKHYKLHEDLKQRFWQKVGVYGIYSNNKLVYVGKSNNLFNRFVAHQMNTFEEQEKEYNSKKYVALRQAALAGARIEIRIICYCKPEQLSNTQEFYISNLYPPLNTYINHKRTPVESIRYTYDDKCSRITTNVKKKLKILPLIQDSKYPFVFHVQEE